MRVVVNDYSGHPFQIDLSRELARRGHAVLHLYFADFLTPHGDLTMRPDDPAGLVIDNVSLGQPFRKYAFVKRRRQEILYGRRLCEKVRLFAPDIVVGCNNPLDAQQRLVEFCARETIPFVFWLQDLYSIAIRSVLAGRLPLVGTAIGLWYEAIERRLLRRSDHIVAIADDFLDRLAAWNLDRTKISVIENWAPRDAIRERGAATEWRRLHGLAHNRVVLYTGTLGLKHNPALFIAAAAAMRDMADVKIVIASEGPYADWVNEEAARLALPNILVLPFQPFDLYGDVLASADILVALIDPEPGSYSVPSKVLSYMCSARPIVLAARGDNLAARIITRGGAGCVVDPTDEDAFSQAIIGLLGDAARRAAAGRAARAYADEHFDVVKIADRFEAVFAAAAARAYGGAVGRERRQKARRA